MTDPRTLMDYGAMALFAAFIPVLAGISVYLRHDRANTKLNAAVALYGLEGDRYYRIYLGQKSSELWRRTWFPISVMFWISLYFAFLILHTNEALGSNNVPSNLLVLGQKWHPDKLTAEAQAYRVGTFTTIAFAYLGWYVWSIATIFSRLGTLELVATTYMNMLIRLVMAVILAIVFRHLASSLFISADVLSSVAIGFGAGIFPDAALVWISRELRNRLLGQRGTDNEIPLDIIQGISPYRKIRLYEMGMDNCQNLAASNPILVFVTSNLSLLEVLDWISQAQLAVIVGAGNFIKLQSNGWRQARDFERACSGTAKQVVSALIGYDERQLDDLRKGLLNDPNFKRVEALRQRIKTADENDKASPIASATNILEVAPASNPHSTVLTGAVLDTPLQLCTNGLLQHDIRSERDTGPRIAASKRIRTISLHKGREAKNGH
jgi:hypothetical protein